MFYCPGGTSQLVLATLGQAFELRYKMYLGSTPPQSQHSTTSPQPKLHLPAPLPPLPEPPIDRRSDSFISSRHGNSSDPPPYSNSEYSDPLPPPLPPPLSSGNNSPMNGHGKKRLPSEPVSKISHCIARECVRELDSNQSTLSLLAPLDWSDSSGPSATPTPSINAPQVSIKTPCIL